MNGAVSTLRVAPRRVLKGLARPPDLPEDGLRFFWFVCAKSPLLTDSRGRYSWRVVVLSPHQKSLNKYQHTAARYLAPYDHASHTRILRGTPQAAYTRLDSFLDRFAAFFSFGVRVAFFFSSLLFLSSLGMVFAPNICVWGYGPMPPYEIPVCA
jgi:hypothetical protein